jgi:hypothetical protein
MRKLTLILSLGALLMLCCQCTTSKHLRQAQKGAKDVPHQVLDNYFVRNDINCEKTQQLIFDNEQDFNAFFGPAAVMGGLPTDINWKKQFVIAVLLPETNRPTMVTPLEVKQNENNIIMKYRVNRGNKTSYTLVPFTAVALNRPENQQEFSVFFIEK